MLCIGREFKPADSLKDLYQLCNRANVITTQALKMTISWVATGHCRSRFLFWILFIDRKNVTKPRNKTKEFLFNLVFFIIFPVLPLFKLCTKIAKCCCRKKPKPEEETKRKIEDASDDERQGPEVDILKEGGIFLKDGSLRSSVNGVSSKENMSGIKRSHSTDSSGSSLVIKKSKHGSKDNIASAGNKRASTSMRGTEEGMETRKSHRKASVQEKPELLVRLYFVCC